MSNALRQSTSNTSCQLLSKRTGSCRAHSTVLNMHDAGAREWRLVILQLITRHPTTPKTPLILDLRGDPDAHLESSSLLSILP
jgi:hypothetical protein